MDNHTEPIYSLDDNEITLRCSRCGKPISPAEAVQTPTGYRCRECVRQQQKVFDTSRPLDLVLGFVIAAALSLVGSYLTTRIGYFTFLLAPAAGVVVAEAVRMATQKRRSKKLFRAVTIGMIVGGLPLILLSVFNLVMGLSLGAFNLFSLLPAAYQVLYLVLAVPSAHYRISGSRRY